MLHVYHSPLVLLVEDGCPSSFSGVVLWREKGLWHTSVLLFQIASIYLDFPLPESFQLAYRLLVKWTDLCATLELACLCLGWEESAEPQHIIFMLSPTLETFYPKSSDNITTEILNINWLKKMPASFNIWCNYTLLLSSKYIQVC